MTYRYVFYNLILKNPAVLHRPRAPYRYRGRHRPAPSALPTQNSCVHVHAVTRCWGVTHGESPPTSPRPSLNNKALSLGRRAHGSCWGAASDERGGGTSSQQPRQQPGLAQGTSELCEAGRTEKGRDARWEQAAEIYPEMNVHWALLPQDLTY